MALPQVGLYGKLPSHGDFLRRRVSDAFVGVWDGWLQECLEASRWALGERWLDVYLTSPAWRFACAAGTCGPAPVVGLMVPSVDRVGRYFPLTLVAELPQTASLISIAGQAEAFFDSAERLVVETLAAEQVDFESFDERVFDLGHDLGSVACQARLVLEGAAAAVLADGAQAGWQIPIGSSSQLAPAFEQLLWQRISSLHEPLALWWTEGSSIVEPSCLVARGLPDPETFAAFLDGSWTERRWQPVAAYVEAATALETLTDGTASLRYRSAAATDRGRVRDINQDAFIERPEVGVWAVADGLGGHSHGEIASRMVCDALADIAPRSSFSDAIEDARQRICDVNEHLLRAATRSLATAASGSTVVALLARGTRCAVLWAGDSRVYRWRGGRLEQLTRDHSLANAGAAPGAADAHAVTRAVGGEPELTLDSHIGRTRIGDRFLLCSDGLTRMLNEDQIRAWMEKTDIRVAVDGLIDATLDAGAPDNVTALIVEAFD